MAENEAEGGPNSPAPKAPTQGEAAAAKGPVGEVRQAVAEVDAKAVKAAQIVDSWVSSELRNSPLSRVTTAWNHLVEKIPALVAAIQKEL